MSISVDIVVFDKVLIGYNYVWSFGFGYGFCG